MPRIRINISLTDDDLKLIDSNAKQCGLTRSAYIVQASTKRGINPPPPPPPSEEAIILRPFPLPQPKSFIERIFDLFRRTH